MKYGTTITSKGTITIAAPIRKALGFKPGQKLDIFINKNMNVEIDAGISIEEFVKRRDERLQKVKIPEHLKGLSARELREIAANEVKGR
ncbi:MAG TPA: AbrB/MazE/SpoVT family DNA-binding domain-containing protein [Pyrinomonadaceae bacterium]|nr:AbrB/MazE/SpoVT family DNA-binding domain-containing protein [Pyrinomonadaceae bacterium]